LALNTGQIERRFVYNQENIVFIGLKGKTECRDIGQEDPKKRVEGGNLGLWIRYEPQIVYGEMHKILLLPMSRNNCFSEFVINFHFIFLARN
jgi:hypothetical protein